MTSHPCALSGPRLLKFALELTQLIAQLLRSAFACFHGGRQILGCALENNLSCQYAPSQVILASANRSHGLAFPLCGLLCLLVTPR